MVNINPICNIEYLDLVDEKDNVIGRDDRNKIISSETKNYRVINILIFNSKGELIVPKRSGNRRLFPNCYDFSVGGHVQSGESYEEAAYRELQEELGIQNVVLHEIGYFHPEDIGTSSFSKLYKLNYDGNLYYDMDGIAEIKYFDLKSIYKLLKENSNNFKGDFKPIFYWYLKKYINDQEIFFL